jgi:hypothetical protein
MFIHILACLGCTFAVNNRPIKEPQKMGIDFVSGTLAGVSADGRFRVLVNR